MSKSRYRHHARRWKARRPGRRNPGAKYASGYSHGAAVERMYRKLQRHGAGALNAKELRLLRRESDAEQRNPGRDHQAPRRRHHARHNRAVRRGSAMWKTAMKCARAADGDYDRVLAKGQRRIDLVRHGKPSRWNPKRDGTPTRGEIRKGKYASHLKTIAQRGKDAEAILARVTGVPSASKAAVKEHLPSASVAVLEAPPAKVEAAVEHAEAKFLRSRIDELTILHKDLMEQIDQLGDDDLTASEAADFTEQAAKIAKQRTKLREKATSLGIQTNPRRNPGRRGGRRVLIGLHRYGAALKHLHRAIRALR